jgi:ribosomal protein L11 methyltransferase
MSDQPAHVLRVCMPSERAARALADVLGELLDLDETAVSVFETAPETWSVALYGARPFDGAPLRALIAAHAGADAALAVDTLAPKDWVAASLAGLRPVRAGRFVVYGAHARGAAGHNRVAIEIEAALAFGTGHHGTTRGCLLALDRILRTRRLRRVLDLGTGTGVLAIAAAKAARVRVLASDSDARAVRVAGANTRANGVGALVEVVCAVGPRGARVRRGRPYDLIFANILLLPLQRMAAALSRLIAPGGAVVLSGLLPGHANAALAAYRMQGLYLAWRIDLEGWVTLVLVPGQRQASTGPETSLPVRRCQNRLFGIYDENGEQARRFCGARVLAHAVTIAG